jgi:hypothetical protein
MQGWLTLHHLEETSCAYKDARSQNSRQSFAKLACARSVNASLGWLLFGKGDRHVTAFAAAELGNAVLAAQAFAHDADLLLGGGVLADGAAEFLDYHLGRLLGQSSFLSHRLFLKGHDETETLPSSTHPICFMSTDGEHWDSGLITGLPG